MSPLEKKDWRLGEGKCISKKKLSTRTMIKKAVRGGKIDFHLIDFHRPPKNSTQPLYFPNGSSLIPPHVTESGIWEKFACGSGILAFRVRSTAQRIRNDTSYWNSTDQDRNRVPGIRNPESVTWNPESQAILDCLTWGDL